MRPRRCRASSVGGSGVLPEPPDGAVDAEERFPDELGNYQDVHQTGLIPRVEEHAYVPEQEERPPDESEPGHAPGNEAGLVHQVAEDQAVPEGDDHSRAEQERPVLERASETARSAASGESWRRLTTPSTKMIPTAMKTDSMIRAAT